MSGLTRPDIREVLVHPCLWCHRGGDMSGSTASPYGVLPGEFVIRTFQKKNFLTARDGGHHSIDAVITSATIVVPDGEFKLTGFPPNFVSIQTQLGYYVSAAGAGGRGGDFDPTQTLQTERLSVADDALWRLTGPSPGGIIGLRTFDGHFLTALGGGGKKTAAFHTDATVENEWEWFSVLKSGDLGSGFRYAIRPAGVDNTSAFLTVLGAQPTMTFDHLLSANSIFTLAQLDDGRYALQLPDGERYVSAVGGGGLANGDNLLTATHVLAWEKFRFVDQRDGTYAIQTDSGFFSL